MNILFVCRHNRFRSRFAELYLNKINKNSNLKTKSAGIFLGAWPLDKLEVKIAKKFGVKLRGKPKPISTKILRWVDLIILITNDINDPENLFNYGKHNNKIIQWKIKDNDGNSEENIKNILNQVAKETKKLNQKLLNQNV